MKKLNLILGLLLVAIIFVACQKEGDPMMSAKIDGTTWTTVTRVTKHISSPASFVITGTSVDGKVVVITIKGDQEGTYTSSSAIDTLNAQVGAVWQPSATSPTTDNFVSKSGTVTISEIDSKKNTISGTFTFVLSNLSEEKSITDGKFSDLEYSDK